MLRTIIAYFSLILPILLQGQTIETLPSGSFIIDMGRSPQTVNNALKPYGLVYDLMRNHEVPVKWVINHNKGKDGIDFSYGGTNFRGGPFIIPAGNRTAAVNATISSWQSKGVVGVTTNSAIAVPVIATLDYYMIWTLDQQNGKIAKGYFDNAEIPSSAFNWVDPSNLTCCNDVFIMPHADPTWSKHNRLYSWNDSYANGGCAGSIWAACHAVSALENVFNPSSPSTQLNFLSQKTGTASGSGYADNSLILWKNHKKGKNPYLYEYHGHPVMQFLGKMDDAVNNGSEQIYLPHRDWRHQTYVSVWDPDNTEVKGNTEAAIVAFGDAFGDPSKGKVMYQAGHNHSKSNGPANIAAQRAMFNFSFWSASKKAIQITTNISASFALNNAANLSATITGGTGVHSYEWSASCTGSFSNPSSANTTFTPTVSGSCILTVKVSDGCGRTSYASVPITISNNPQPPTADDDFGITSECGTVTINLLDGDNDPEGGSLSLSLLSAGSGGTFVDNGNGTVTYTADIGFTGPDVISYQVCSSITSLCDIANVTVTVGANTPPTALDDSENVQTDGSIELCVLDNDSDPEGSNLMVNILTAPADGTISQSGDKITFIPDPGFMGTTSFTYEACDDGCVSLCDPAIVTLDIGCNPVPGQSDILGTVFLDQDANAALDNGELGEENVNVNLYTDVNGDGLLDAGDTLVETQTTNANGAYQFSLTALTGGGGGGPVTCTSPSYTEQTAVSTTADRATSVFAIDLDGDGDMDMLSASENDDKIAWYENDGSENFTENVISTNADAASSIYAIDVDGDGDTDVLSASFQDDKIAWYENDGSENFTENVISTNAAGAWSVFAIDLDGDGDMDVLSASRIDHKIAWYENDGSQNFTERIVSSYSGQVRSVYAIDVDGDGDIDVLSASFFDDKIAWHENDGSQNFTENVISYTDGAQSVYAIDVDGDGDIDALSASSVLGSEIAWYENDGSQNFTKNVISTNANGANSVFAIDVDGDGDIDVLSASSGDDKIAWYENDGSQNFTENVISTNADGASSVFAIDVNGDGDIDVLSASLNDDKIAWYDSDCAAIGSPPATCTSPSYTEQPPVSTTAGLAQSVHAIDIDGDGDMDMLSASTFDDKIAWYENDGSQNFTENVISTNADGAQSVYAIDVDGDGDMDVLSASSFDNKIAWYENDGSQNFTENVISTNAAFAFSVFAIDVDGDGDIDVLSASDFDNKIAWYENDGSQNFTENVISTNADDARSVFVIDVDGDGDMDVLSASSQDDKIAWYENDGSQNFTENVISTNADHPQSVYAIDIDGDGDIDVLSASSHDNKIAWYENDGSQNFTENVISTNANWATSVFAIDVDGDGDVDVLSASYLDDKIALYENDDSQNFTENVISTNANGALSVFAIDVNGDGDVDVLSASENDDKIAWYDSDCAAIGSPPATCTSPSYTEQTAVSTTANGAQSVCAIDVDGDGDMDMLSASYFDDKIAWYENDGSQNFTENVISTNADGAKSVYAIDVDGDGDIDVLSASGNDDKIAWYENDGSQNFTENVISTNAAFAFSVFAIDVDGDGDIDVLSASYFDDKIAWYENDGSQNFTENVISTNADTARSVFAIDLDGDGDIDALSASGFKIAWYENDGSQNFTENVISTNANGAFSVFAIDVDGDGDMDVLSASGFKIAWYENDGSQNFTENVISTNADGAASVFAIDLNGDGDMDVLSASFNDNKIAWYENDGSQNFTENIIPTFADEATSVFAIDLNGDGDIDVLSASADDDKITWYDSDCAAIVPPLGGDYLIAIDQMTLPTGNFAMTTDTVIAVSFSGLGEISCSNNFGFDLFNNPPVAVFDTDTTELNVAITVTPIANDYDLDGDSIYVNEITIIPSQGGTAVLNPDGTITYTPAVGYAGTDTLSYSICDDGSPSLCDTNQIEIVIYPYNNDPPIAVDDTETTEVDVEVCVDVLDNDSEPEGENINPPVSAGTDASNGLTVQGGVVVIAAEGTICYMPPSGYIGVDNFDYVICDPGGLCDTATVIITISPPFNDAPVARDETVSVCTNLAETINILNNDYDVDGSLDPSSVSIITNASNGNAVSNGDSTITYTSNIAFTGLDSIEYQICDDGVPVPIICSTAKVYFNVTAVNTSPVGQMDIDTLHFYESEYLSVLDNDSDLENDNLTVTINTAPTNGTAVVESNGLILYTPNFGFSGDDFFTYSLCDDGCPSLCDVVPVSIHIEDCVSPALSLVLLDSIVCASSTTLMLTGGSPIGGTYSGPGVSGGNFDAASVGAGVYTITYSYTDSIGCTNTETDDISVIECISNGGETMICNDNGTETPLDDSFTLFLNPVGSNLGATYSVSGDITANNIPYGSSQQIGGSFLISNGNLVLLITDDTNPANQFIVTANAPSPCSPCPAAHLICPGDTITATVLGTLTNIQWYKDTGSGPVIIPAPEGTAETLDIVDVGTYTYIAEDVNGSTVSIYCPVEVQAQICVASIGDFVWHDGNENGIQDIGETGIEGVTAYLYNNTNTLINTTTTANDGSYLFNSVTSGDYYLIFDVSTNTAGFSFYKGTLQNIGSSTTDSDPNAATGRTSLFSFDTTMGNQLSLDAGYIQSCPPSSRGSVNVIRKMK